MISYPWNNSRWLRKSVWRPIRRVFHSTAKTLPKRSGARKSRKELLRELAGRTSVVMEGRDIGTVVFPDADVKIFLDAMPEVRADRRVKDLAEKAPPPPSKDRVLAELNERDHRDRTRVEAPLMQAPDAVLMDSTGLSIEEVEERILKIIRSKTTNGKELAAGGE
jgi:CMP/dCMP kinase